MTPKQEAALRQAREALKKCDSALAEELAAWDIDPPLHHVLEASNACGPVIAAINDALAEHIPDANKMVEQPKLSDYEPDGMHHNKLQQRPQNCGTGYCSCIECPYEQPAQKPEPVAYIRKDQLQKAAQSPMLCEVTPEPRQDRIGIHTSPPASKPWVGLTPEDKLEIEKIVGITEDDDGWMVSQMFTLTEAKLKEKNRG